MKIGDVVEYITPTGASVQVQVIMIDGDEVGVGPLSNPWGTMIIVPKERIKKVENRF